MSQTDRQTRNLASLLENLFSIGNSSPIGRFSDDYNFRSDAICTGGNYAVKIGSTSFSFGFGTAASRYDLHNIRVFIDQIYVLNFTGKIEWQHYSPELEQEISRCCQSILTRYFAEQDERARKEKAQEVENQDALTLFKKKWGVM